MTNLDGLKTYLRKCRKTGTVREWNELREIAKRHFPAVQINQLDASGFIVQWRNETIKL